ncbi:hypothetical protein [Roseibium alexandrii]|uniref:hypothetical protein n=1 Tax=Roseibium alexandrii TaxID=388408 RepID=UPI0037519D49
MAIMYRRDWDGKEWQRFSKQLVQVRHLPQNVQDVPDKVQGDAGLEFITSDGCCYQSYAPEETSDVAKAASAMKSKGARDLRKLVKNKEKIADILGSRKISNWILLCPFLDNKDVISHLQTVAQEVKEARLDFLASDFCALVQSQEDFETEYQQLRAKAVGAPLPIKKPSLDQLETVINKLDQRVEDKLKRAFPLDDGARSEKRKKSYVYAHVERENVLSDLRDDYPDFWEASTECIDAEERRLEMAGAEGDTASQQINSSMDRVANALKSQVPGLSEKQVTSISQGQVGTWLIECPLDFQEPN